MNIMKKYWDVVYNYQLVFIPFSCICAGIYYTMCKSMGIYDQTPWSLVFIFDGSQFLYLMISIYFIHKVKHDTTKIDVGFPIIKWYVTIALLVQYNFIMHLFPSDYVWGCTFLFLVFVMFLFDLKIVIFNIIAYNVSLGISYLLHSEQHLAANTNHYVAVLGFRVIIIILYDIFLIAISYFVEKFINRIQLEEDENQFLIEKQLEYYQNLDIMDKELRKFRHDIQNHFLCMQHLLRTNNQAELQQYFEDLMATYTTKDHLYFSGNLIIDSILNYNLTHLCKKNIEPVVYGTLPTIEAVSSMDLCTVFSNMLSNAIKGVNACSQEKPSLIIRFQHGDTFFSITITNSVAAVSSDDQKTNKKPDRNHGYGLHKIKDVAERYHGIFEQEQKEGLFTMQIYLPIFTILHVKENRND